MDTRDQHLEFLKRHGVTEIYLFFWPIDSPSNPSSNEVRAFVEQAKSMGMRVAGLAGDPIYMIPGSSSFQSAMSRFNAYQNSCATDDQRFYALHLDVEPGAMPEFKTNRQQAMQWYADFLINKAVPAARAAKVDLELDVPPWYTDIVQDGEGQDIVLGDLTAKVADTIAVMSYRDTAAAMYSVAQQEIAFAQARGKRVVLGAETYSTEGDEVSYLEEGRIYMSQELSKLRTLLGTRIPSGRYGVAIHHLRTWEALKDCCSNTPTKCGTAPLCP